MLLVQSAALRFLSWPAKCRQFASVKPMIRTLLIILVCVIGMFLLIEK